MSWHKLHSKSKMWREESSCRSDNINGGIMMFWKYIFDVSKYQVYLFILYLLYYFFNNGVQYKNGTMVINPHYITIKIYSNNSWWNVHCTIHDRNKSKDKEMVSSNTLHSGLGAMATKRLQYIRTTAVWVMATSAHIHFLHNKPTS